MERSLIGRAVLASALMCAAPALAAPCQVGDLGWMAGVWRTADGANEERWVAAPGDRLMGSAWRLRADKPDGTVEVATILTIGDAVVLRMRHFSAALDQAWEEATAPTSFVAETCGPRTIVFAGEGEHDGDHISYRREGDVLTFTGAFGRMELQQQVVIAFKKDSDR